MQRAPLARDLGKRAAIDDAVLGNASQASQVMLRMSLPLVWMPCMETLASRSITSAALLMGIQLNWQLVRVVKWP